MTIPYNYPPFKTDSNGNILVSISGNIPIISPTTDLSVSGGVISLTAGENTVFGNIGYIKSDGKIWKADESSAGQFPAQFMATATIAANATGVYLARGIARNDSWTWTVGGTIYLSTTGGMTQTAPSSTGNCIQVLGFALSATTIYFNPSPDYITHV